MDKRRALGDGMAPPEKDEFGFVEVPTNRLPGPEPYDRHHDEKPPEKYSGTPNKAIESTRPIADMRPDHGSGDIEKGVAFCVPMDGTPQYDDPDYN